MQKMEEGGELFDGAFLGAGILRQGEPLEGRFDACFWNSGAFEVSGEELAPVGEGGPEKLAEKAFVGEPDEG